jgi:putative transposase
LSKAKPAENAAVQRPPARSTGRPALSKHEQERVLQELCSERFVDQSPRQVYATLLDEGEYLCSWRTMYRLLKARSASSDRRRVRQHPTYTKPELVARAPNQVWSWDITYLKTLIRGCFYYLYVVLDIYSRYVVGWLIADRECQEFAEQLLSDTIHKQCVLPGDLTIHADRGAPMKSQSVCMLLDKLGVDRSHSRPRVSNDNPYSEAGFRTLKYCPDFPDRFDDFEQAQAFCRRYFDRYNTQMHHSGIALLTPSQVHYGQAAKVLAARQATLDVAFARNPRRFGGRRPFAGKLPDQVWINAPAVAVIEAHCAAAA